MVVIKLEAYLKKNLESLFLNKEQFWLGRHGRRFKILHLKQDPQMSPLETWWLERPWSLCWSDSADPPLTHPVEQACLLRLPSSVPCESKSPSFWEKPSANLEWFPPTPEQKASLPQSPLSAFCGCVLQNFLWNLTLETQLQISYSIHRCWLDSKWEKRFRFLFSCLQLVVNLWWINGRDGSLWVLHWPLHFICLANFQGHGSRGNSLPVLLLYSKGMAKSLGEELPTKSSFWCPGLREKKSSALQLTQDETITTIQLPPNLWFSVSNMQPSI